jgi:hypothetical protein
MNVGRGLLRLPAVQELLAMHFLDEEEHKAAAADLYRLESKMEVSSDLAAVRSADGVGVRIPLAQGCVYRTAQEVMAHRALLVLEDEYDGFLLGVGDGEAHLGGHVIGIGELQHLPNLVFLGAVEHRGGKGHAILEVLCKLNHLDILEACDVLGLARGVVDALEGLAKLGHLGLALEHLTDALAKAFGGPAQVGLENLAHVHP